VKSWLASVAGLAVLTIATFPAIAAQNGPPGRIVVATTDQGPGLYDARKLVGMDVKNAQGETIGTVKSAQIGKTGTIQNLIVSVGGFLGFGREVAIAWKNISISPDGERVTANLTRDLLEQLPEYRYGTSAGAATTVSAQTTSGQTTLTDPALVPAGSGLSTAPDEPSPEDVPARALIGAPVKNQADEAIGDVKEVYIKADGGIRAVVVSVGGFLGIGKREVGLPWEELTLTHDKDKLVVMTTASKDELKSLPAYKVD
jgi:sporulation protein YlmC with PRC-barrel domain